MGDSHTDGGDIMVRECDVCAHAIAKCGNTGFVEMIKCLKRNDMLYLDRTKTDYKFKNNRYLGHCATFRFSPKIKEQIEFNLYNYGLNKWDAILGFSDVNMRDYPNRKAKSKQECEWCHKSIETESWVKLTKQVTRNEHHILHLFCFKWIEDRIQQLKDEYLIMDPGKNYRYYTLPNGFDLIVNHNPIVRGF